MATMGPEYPTGGGAGMARERSTADLVKEMVANAQEIIRSEVRLAKTEIREETKKASRGAAMLAAGGVLALYAFGFLLVTILDLLALAVPNWGAALIVSFLLIAPAAILLAAGRSRLKQVRAPEKTIDSVKEDVQWARNQTR